MEKRRHASGEEGTNWSAQEKKRKGWRKSLQSLNPFLQGARTIVDLIRR